MKFFFCIILLIATTAAEFLLPVVGYSFPPEEDKGGLELFFYSKSLPTEFIVVEKKYQRLSVFEQGDQVKLLRTFVCATGQNPGTKQTIGDSRTPEGFYFITEIYEDKRITVFGSRAFHLNYPNIFDSHAGHLGDGIFIHGTNKELVPYSTNGCIALSNQDLDELAPYLTVNTIPIIILDALPEPLVGKSLMLQPDTTRFAEVLGVLSFDLVKTPVQDIQALSFLREGGKAVATVKYATYERDQLQYREQVRTYLTRSPVDTWRNVYTVQSQEKNPYLLAQHPMKNELVTRLAPLEEPPAVEPTEPERPAHPVLMAAAATIAPAVATAAVSSFESNPPAQLVRVAKAVEQRPVPVLATLSAEPKPKKRIKAVEYRQISAASKIVAKPSAIVRSKSQKREDLLNFMETWRSSWVNKDIKTYISCYSPSFTNAGLDLDGWKQKKISLNKRYAYIKVSIKNIVVQWTSTGANVSFFQTYKSDQYETTGTKMLHLINRDNRWLIESEIM